VVEPAGQGTAPGAQTEATETFEVVNVTSLILPPTTSVTVAVKVVEAPISVEADTGVKFTVQDFAAGGVGVLVLVGVAAIGVGVLVLVGVAAIGVGVLVLVGVIVGNGHVTLLLAENTTKSLVVLAYAILPVGIPGIAPMLSLEEMVIGEGAGPFHHQVTSVSSHTCSPIPLVQLTLTGVVPVEAL